MKKRLFNNKRPTIGLLLDNIRTGFNELFWHALTTIAEKKDVNIIIFPTEYILSEKGDINHYTMIGEFINNHNIDGLLILSNAFSNYINPNETEKRYLDYAGIPTISIGLEVEGIHSIVANNCIGMREATEHLIFEHGLKRIAFIKGALNHKEAEVRFETYKQVLEENGIAIDETLVYQGDFTMQSGIDAVTYFVNNDLSKVDAMIAANDEMAIGALVELKSKGFFVPRDIKVIGFDNILEPQSNHSPLTTVKYPVYDMSFSAIEHMLQLIEGNKLPLLLTLPTKLIKRSSCGCNISSKVHTNSDADEIEAKNKLSYNDLKHKLVALCNENMFYDSGLAEELDKVMNELFEEKMTKKLIENLQLKIENIFGRVVFNNEEVTEWTNLFEYFYKLLVVQNRNKKEERYYAQFFELVKVAIMRRNITEQELIRIQNERTIQTLMVDGVHRLLAVEHLDALMCSIEKELHHIEVNTCFINLYRHPEKEINSYNEESLKDLQKHSKLVLAYNDDYKFSGDVYSYESEYLSILPEDLVLVNRRYTMAIEPLFFGDEQYGYIFYELGLKIGSIYEPYKRQICTALKYIYLLEEKNRANQGLDEYILKQQITNEELKMTLSNLKEAQAQLVQSEKIGALATLVTGIANEMQEPLGNSIIISSNLEEESADLLNKYYNNELKKSELEAYISGTVNLCHDLLANLMKASDMLKSFKLISTAEPLEKETINVRELVEQVVLSMSTKLKKTLIIVDIQIPRDLVIVTYPSSLEKILANLISNAMIHGYDVNQRGIITIGGRITEDSLVIEFADNGKGIDKTIIDKIFDPFFTTQSHKGYSGLGLNIVYNIVTQRYNGEIVCESDIGEGALFKVVLPMAI